ncbi:DUF6223 family protein [Dactylosporangium sp. NPDC000521]|uniref:DUF6223 family protein n=1 Tax=Dactylosporangium sp. NPDC000521 TaxID=3363975 RepID=UPI003693EE75
MLASVDPMAATVAMMSAGRGTAILAGVIALLGIAIGAAALNRSRNRSANPVDPGNLLRWTFAAPVLGVSAVILGAVVVATADGGVGTGNGLAGGVVAVVLGLTAIVLGALALRRTRRAG